MEIIEPPPAESSSLLCEASPAPPEVLTELEAIALNRACSELRDVDLEARAASPADSSLFGSSWLSSARCQAF